MSRSMTRARRDQGTAQSSRLLLAPTKRYGSRVARIAPAALAAAVKGAPVEVSAQPGTRYQDVVHALDMARGAGARVLGLANKR